MRQRLLWIDYAKGFTIFLVVMYHSFTYLIPKVNGYEMTIMDFASGFLFLFIMPLFFALSGYLHKNVENIDQYKEQIIKQIKGFLVPYIFFSIIYVFLENLSGSSNVTHFRSFRSLAYMFTDPIAHTWFLMALFLMTIIIGMFDLIKIPLRNQLIISFIFTVVGVSLSSYIFDSLDRTLSYLVFFVFGECLSWIDKNDYNFRIKNKIMFYLFCIVLAIFIIQYLFISNSLNKYISIIQGLLSILFFFPLYKKINVQSAFGKYFTKYGRYSLVIYLVHVPVIAVVKSIIVKLINVNNFTTPLIFLLLLLIGWYSSLFVIYLSNKNSIVHFILYPNKIFKKVN